MASRSLLPNKVQVIGSNPSWRQQSQVPTVSDEKRLRFYLEPPPLILETATVLFRDWQRGHRLEYRLALNLHSMGASFI